ncbi:MAG TPA: O-antigen ligase family protein [Cyclobacteriaceae bacterium]|nr:O-antigen ligase family protein [Cyclobacteriaceae bacterium]
MDKRHIINGLFILSFPVYGIGTYISASISPSAGYLASLSMHVLILTFYIIDLIYRREIRFRLNKVYLAMLVYILTVIASLFVAQFKGLPESNTTMISIRSLLLLLPFHSFIAFTLYNDGHEDELPMLLIKGLSALMFVNLVGYFVLGMSNAQHSIDGRLNMPFLDGFYSGASVLAILNLLIAYRIRSNNGRPLESMLLTAYFLMNLALLYMINSRLAMMIFLVIFVMFVMRIIAMRGMFIVSLLFIPILLSSALLLYELVQLPGLSDIVRRVDVEDVTTFNGRAFLWKDGIDWLMDSREGLILGNGYKGHYFLNLITDVAELWNTDEVFHLHMHSTSLEVLICQGLISYLIFCGICLVTYNFFRKKHKEGKLEGSFLGPMLYLLFILQVDTFVYMDGMGFVLLAVLVSRVAVTDKERHTTAIEIPLVRPLYEKTIYETEILSTI